MANINIGQETKIVFPPLHAAQQVVFDDPHRFKVLVMGRRGGKSFLAKRVLLDKAVNEGEEVWFVSLTFTNVMTHWREAKTMVGQIATYMNERDKYMEFHIQGRRGSIMFKSAATPDNLLGSGLNFIVVDEAAYLDDDIWPRVLRPMLSDKQGGALFISTPNGTANWFYRLYLRGRSGLPEDEDWASYRFRTVDNTFIPGIDKEVESARRDLPDLKFRQEYLAEFVSDAGGVFRNLDNVTTLEPLMEPLENHAYIAGIDWGRRNDFTVFSVFDKHTREQVTLDRFTEIGWSVQRDRLLALFEKWKPTRIYAEANSVGSVNIEALQALGLPIEPVYMTNITKTGLVERFAASIERGNLRLLNNRTPIGEQQIGELQSYSIQRTKSGLSITYGAPQGWHDDIVVADLMVNIGLTDMFAPKVQAYANPFYGTRNPIIEPDEFAHLPPEEQEKAKVLQMLNDRRKNKYAASNGIHTTN